MCEQTGGLIVLDRTALTVRTEALLRALGCPDSAQTEDLRQAAEDAIACAAAAADPRVLWRRFPLAWGEDTFSLAGSTLTLPGKDITAHLAGCRDCILFAVTLGLGIERALAGLSADPIAAMYFDTACSLLVEEAADAAEKLMPAHDTWRYSPGYGDLPLEIQGRLLAVIDAPRQLGLTLTDSGMMLPRKSITAIVGCA